MAMWIGVGMIAAVVFGFPMLPVLVIGGIAMSGLSFVLTRDKRIARIGLGFGVVVLNYLLVRNVLATAEQSEVLPWASWLASDSHLAIVSCIVIVVTLYLGIFGPVQHLPLNMDDVLKMVEDCDKKHQDPDNKP